MSEPGFKFDLDEQGRIWCRVTNEGVLLSKDEKEQVIHVIEQLESENAKLRATLKQLMVGTHRELCADRHALQCRGCSMRGDDDKSCVVADAMELLGCDVYGNPMPEDTSDKR